MKKVILLLVIFLWGVDVFGQMREGDDAGGKLVAKSKVLSEEETFSLMKYIFYNGPGGHPDVPKLGEEVVVDLELMRKLIDRFRVHGYGKYGVYVLFHVHWMCYRVFPLRVSLTSVKRAMNMGMGRLGYGAVNTGKLRIYKKGASVWQEWERKSKKKKPVEFVRKKKVKVGSGGDGLESGGLSLLFGGEEVLEFSVEEGLVLEYSSSEEESLEDDGALWSNMANVLEGLGAAEDAGESVEETDTEAGSSVPFSSEEEALMVGESSEMSSEETLVAIRRAIEEASGRARKSKRKGRAKRMMFRERAWLLSVAQLRALVLLAFNQRLPGGVTFRVEGLFVGVDVGRLMKLVRRKGIKFCGEGKLRRRVLKVMRRFGYEPDGERGGIWRYLRSWRGAEETLRMFGLAEVGKRDG